MIFKINLTLVENDIVFEPTFKQVEDGIFALLDDIMDRVSHIPRLETKLFAEWKTTHLHMKVGMHIP